MPWNKTEPMDQKIKLIADWKEKEYSITDLSRKYRISRKTVYKWMLRYTVEGIDGLKERSRSHIWHPRTTDMDKVNRIIEVKRKYRNWGPKKIIVKLNEWEPERNWPAASTAGEWLKKRGYVKSRKKSRRVPGYSEPFIDCTEPNDVWSADYKGQFKTLNNKICYPLTISDNNSRYILGCKALPGPRYKETREEFEKVFKEYGLPLAIRIDNGTPFAGPGIGGLSRLSAWWIKLGICPERIEKGKPQQNGRHERMHRTLKEDTVTEQVGEDLEEQQEKFDWFKIEYNEERPHESLGQIPPGRVYSRSKREYTDKPNEPEYDLDMKVRRVRTNGEIKFKGNKYFISELLTGEDIGLKEVAEGKLQINYYLQPLGVLNLLSKKIAPIEKRKKCYP